MFGFDQRQRLMRESWTANSLAEELFAMFSPDAPNDTQAPVQVSLPTGSTVAPFQIGNAPVDGPTSVFNITHTDGSDGGSITFDGGNFFFTEPGGTPVAMGGGSGGGGGPVIPVWG